LTVTAAAAKKHRHRVRAPIVVQTYPGWDAPRTGLWADRCTTDEGYGRRLPCDYGGK
jgi:hypothetical protein